MKLFKLVSVVLLSILSVAAYAQQPASVGNGTERFYYHGGAAHGISGGYASDSLINTDTMTHVISITAGYQSIAVSPVVTKVSGTVAGTVRIYGSVDGVNYNQIDSLVLSNQTTNFTIKSYTPIYQNIKVQYITSGTQTYTPKTWYILRKYLTRNGN